MNILLIPNNDWLNHPVPAQRHYKIFETLGQKHNVYVLHFELFKRSKQTHYPKFTKIIKPFTIHISDPTQFYIANLPFQIAKVLTSIKKLAIDVVFGSHLAVCTLGFAISKFYRVRTVFDLSDFFPASVIAYYPKVNTAVASLMYSSTMYTMNQNIRMADLCTTCSESLKVYAQRVSPNTQVEQIPNGVDTQLFSPKKPSQKLQDELDLQGDGTLIYVGSIESWLDFDTVFKAMNLLKKEGIHVQLLIVGRKIYQTSDNGHIHSTIKKYDLEKQVKFLGYKPYESLPYFINLCIAGLIPFRTNSFLTTMAFPNKLVEYLACGKPVLSPPLTELIKVGGSYVHAYTDPESLAKQIKQTITSKYDLAEIRRRSLSYDWKKIVKRLDNFLMDIVD